jgi:hypothetical protein
MPKSSEYIGFIRYRGKPLEQGYLDARKSAEALLGFDESLRYFIGTQNNELSKVDYEIPVLIRNGSWIAQIPQDIAVYIKPALAIIATAYLAGAAKKMAENDFENISIASLFKMAIQGIQWTLKIGKHLGYLSKQTFENIKWRGTEIGIPNDKGEYLYVPKMFLDFFEKMPANLLSKLASLVTEDIKLEVGVRQNNKDEVESLEVIHKSIFCPDSEKLVFPELEHGKEVKLTGLVTRGNENTNTIGFRYRDHILTCYPQDGSIVRFKSGLFIQCEIVGVVTRKNELGEIVELKPKIIVSNLIPPKPDNPENIQYGLFDNEK